MAFQGPRTGAVGWLGKRQVSQSAVLPRVSPRPVGGERGFRVRMEMRAGRSPPTVPRPVHCRTRVCVYLGLSAEGSFVVPGSGAPETTDRQTDGLVTNGCARLPAPEPYVIPPWVLETWTWK